MTRRARGTRAWRRKSTGGACAPIMCVRDRLSQRPRGVCVSSRVNKVPKVPPPQVPAGKAGEKTVHACTYRSELVS